MEDARQHLEDDDLQNWDPWGTTYTVCLHSTVLLRVVLDLLRVVRVFTFILSSLSISWLLYALNELRERLPLNDVTACHVD
ncbi:hypothetical protein T4D_844 [Trichinella pseudospiralis]|uniref:Uncharacterized protein n=1 Tax=Trichinella pseudospiralis TaxID=6337 RepID=A0A0V1FKE1_TRIPS|nr:hypothetical protein T4D_844 [Trichinella pseudospiralis]